MNIEFSMCQIFLVVPSSCFLLLPLSLALSFFSLFLLFSLVPVSSNKGSRLNIRGSFSNSVSTAQFFSLQKSTCVGVYWSKERERETEGEKERMKNVNRNFTSISCPFSPKFQPFPLPVFDNFIFFHFLSFSYFPLFSFDMKIALLLKL